MRLVRRKTRRICSSSKLVLRSRQQGEGVIEEEMDEEEEGDINSITVMRREREVRLVLYAGTARERSAIK